MKVAITFIGTNKYLDFLPRYYENIKEYFLPDTEKVFLVFTDGDGDFPDDVKVFEQEHLEWPYITLKRFEILNKSKKRIKDCDYLVFIDADAFSRRQDNRRRIFLQINLCLVCIIHVIF